MTITDHDEAEVVALFGRDVTATLGAAYLDIVRSVAQHSRQFETERDCYVDRVVGEIYQYVHDCFLDTAVPAGSRATDARRLLPPASSGGARSRGLGYSARIRDLGRFTGPTLCDDPQS